MFCLERIQRSSFCFLFFSFPLHSLLLYLSSFSWQQFVFWNVCTSSNTDADRDTGSSGQSNPEQSREQYSSCRQTVGWSPSRAGSGVTLLIFLQRPSTDPTGTLTQRAAQSAALHLLEWQRWSLGTFRKVPDTGAAPSQLSQGWCQLMWVCDNCVRLWSVLGLSISWAAVQARGHSFFFFVCWSAWFCLKMSLTGIFLVVTLLCFYTLLCFSVL